MFDRYRCRRYCSNPAEPFCTWTRPWLISWLKKGKCLLDFPSPSALRCWAWLIHCAGQIQHQKILAPYPPVGYRDSDSLDPLEYGVCIPESDDMCPSGPEEKRRQPRWVMGATQVIDPIRFFECHLRSIEGGLRDFMIHHFLAASVFNVVVIVIVIRYRYCVMETLEINYGGESAQYSSTAKNRTVSRPDQPGC